MSGKLRVSPDDPWPGDDAQFSEETSPQEKLEWQAELDSALAHIDTRLKNPRGGPAGNDTQPMLPALGQPEITTEMLDEIAFRVAEHLRRANVVAPASAGAPPTPLPAARQQRTVPAPRPPEERSPGLRHGAVVAIRFRWPLFRSPFRWFRRRRKRHPLTTAALI
jgi:hypothetical protein